MPGDDEITTEPADPIAGEESSVPKVGEHLQEAAEGAESESDGAEGDDGADDHRDRAEPDQPG